MSKFRKDELVMHVRDGLCKIVDINKISDNDYYVLVCVSTDEKLYVPVNNSDEVIRDIMSETEAYEYLGKLKEVAKEFNLNTKQRRDGYKRRLSSGMIDDYFFLYRQYYLLKFKNEGEHLGPIDNEMLMKAHRMVLEELKIVFKKKDEEIEEFLVGIIEG